MRHEVAWLFLVPGLLLMAWPVVDGLLGTGGWFLEVWIFGLPLTLTGLWLRRRLRRAGG